jgi:hypothetical protein
LFGFTEALHAVKQWKYKPYLFNGQPVKAETQVTGEFAVGGALVVHRNLGGDNVSTAGTAKMALDASNPIES